MQRGFLKFYRKIEDSGLLQHPKAFALFSYLLLKCAWKPFKYATRHGVISLRRGQYVVGRKALASHLAQSEQNIRQGLKFLEKLQIITTEPTNRFSIITLINYDKYQNGAKNPASRTPASQPAANQQPTTEIEVKRSLSIEPALTNFSEAFKARYGSKPRPSKTTLKNLKDFLALGISGEEWNKKTEIYFAAAWPPEKDLQGIMTHWDKLQNRASGPKKGSKDIC